jgi:hypothetical protein
MSVSHFVLENVDTLDQERARVVYDLKFLSESKMGHCSTSAHIESAFKSNHHQEKKSAEERKYEVTGPDPCGEARITAVL